MRMLSISTLGWLGGVAASGAALSLIATGEENGLPKATERVADVSPAAFSSGNAPDSSGHQDLHGMEPRSHGSSTNLGGEGISARLDGDWSLNKMGSRGTVGFSSGENPLPALPVNLVTVPQGVPVDSQFGASFPSSATGNASAGATKVSGAGSPVTTGYFLVSNNGGLVQGSGVMVPGAAPEPSSWVLGCVAFGALIYLRRRAARP